MSPVEQTLYWNKLTISSHCTNASSLIEKSVRPLKKENCEAFNSTLRIGLPSRSLAEPRPHNRDMKTVRAKAGALTLDSTYKTFSCFMAKMDAGIAVRAFCER